MSPPSEHLFATFCFLKLCDTSIVYLEPGGQCFAYVDFWTSVGPVSGAYWTHGLTVADVGTLVDYVLTCWMFCLHITGKKRCITIWGVP